MEEHGFDKVIAKDSKILILGSFPSVVSRKESFYYMHPSNRFYKLMKEVYLDEDFLSKDIDIKIEALKRHHIALYDVIISCDIHLSDDQSIKNYEVFSLDEILKIAPIEKIILNGKKAYEIFKKYYKDSPVPYFYLPSTSARNIITLDKLKTIYQEIISL